MHLLVLSAFRPVGKLRAWADLEVSMHLLVLSAFRRNGKHIVFGYADSYVSMHLLVLSAFRQKAGASFERLVGLNAPSGAQCFPT